MKPALVAVTALLGLSLAAPAQGAEGKVPFRRKCTVRHLLDDTGRKKVGPNLHGVAGRPIASMPGFGYSKALPRHAGKRWTDGSLSAWLTKPRAFAKGTRMAFPGFRKAGDRAAVITYLKEAAQ